MIYAEYQSRPTTAHGSEPVTPANRQQILEWIWAWGGHGRLTPQGAEDAMVVDSVHGEIPVAYGKRVMYSGVDFYPILPEVFERRWAPVDG